MAQVKVWTESAPSEEKAAATRPCVSSARTGWGTPKC